MLAVNRSEVAVFISPLIPDRDAVIVEILDIGIAVQEPKQLVNDRAQVKLLGRETGKRFTKVETSLGTEYADGPGAGAIGTGLAVFEN